MFCHILINAHNFPHVFIFKLQLKGECRGIHYKVPAVSSPALGCIYSGPRTAHQGLNSKL